jgi:hypothetical protein
MRGDFHQIRSLLESFRLADRTMASDEHRLAWIDEIRDIGRRVTAMTAVLVAEADEAGSAMRARHTRLEDWMARSGQETAEGCRSSSLRQRSTLPGHQSGALVTQPPCSSTTSHDAQVESLDLRIARPGTASTADRSASDGRSR